MEYTLKLTEQDLMIIDKALGELPYKISAYLFQKINEQIDLQKSEK